MVTFLLSAVLLLAAPEVEIVAPDSVGVGEVFAVEITVTGAELNDVRCTPGSTGGLDFHGSGSVSSFSSVTTSGGVRRVSRMILTLTFSAPGPGLYEVGPFEITATGMGRMELPAVTVAADGGRRGGRPRVPSDRTLPDPAGLQDASPAWVEVTVDTSGTVYPGCPFEATYFLCTPRSDLWRVNYSIGGSAHAGSRTLEAPTELYWRRGPGGVRRSLVLRLEITPAFPCSLALPVVQGVVSIRTGPIETEYAFAGDTAWVPVMPFPEEGRPGNFCGAADSLSLTLSRVPGGYSMAAERCLALQVSGPGASMLREPPALSVRGPASILFGPREERTSGARWLVLVQPSDSGTVVLGPDSVAWFDRGGGVYRQAAIPPCTLTVRAPIRGAALPEIDAGPSGGGAILMWAVLVPILAVITLLIVRAAGRRGSTRSIAEAQDPEELLTALEEELSAMLKGTASCMGFEELNEALDDVGADNILQRRLMRFWKDLELHLSGRPPSPGQLDPMKKTASELLEELSEELRRLRG